MTRFSRAIVYLLVFAAFAVAGGVFIANAITRPVSGASDEFTAEFTDVAGLRPGNDVRSLGVRVGKVTGIELYRPAGADVTLARVDFTLTDSQRIFGDSRLAIRYLNLTGIRYLDLQQQARAGAPRPPGSVIGTDSTTPSFDITRVFRGLAPVFAVMSPDDINHFSESMLALVQGDGTGLDRFIASLSKVVQFTDDRSALIDTLVRNLTELSSSITGGAQYLTPIVNYLGRFGSVLARVTPELRTFADVSGAFIVEVDKLLATLGLRENGTPDLNYFVGQALPFARATIGLLGLTPGILNAINTVMPAPGSPATMTCSRGRADLPPAVAIFIKGTQVTLCKR